jgi:hypothetical protein
MLMCQPLSGWQKTIGFCQYLIEVMYEYVLSNEVGESSGKKV